MDLPSISIVFALQFSFIPVGLQWLDFLLFLASGIPCLCHCLAPLPFWLKFNTLCFQYVYWNYEACKLYWGLGLVVSDKRSLVHRTLHLFCSFCSSSFPFSPQLWGKFIYSFPSCLKDLQIPFPLLNRAIFLFLWGLHSPHWFLLPQLLSQQKLFSPLKELECHFLKIINFHTLL